MTHTYRISNVMFPRQFMFFSKYSFRETTIEIEGEDFKEFIIFLSGAISICATFKSTQENWPMENKCATRTEKMLSMFLAN